MARLHRLPACASPEALATMCRAGHALTKRQAEAGGPCPLCRAQAPALSYSWPADLPAETADERATYQAVLDA